MNLIKKEKLDLSIKNNFNYNFEIFENGIYFIEIIASAKSWWQNLKSFKSFFNDDDLAVKIDDIEFSKLNGKKGLFDSEAAWNGNNLKGLAKTGIFAINLVKGNHTLYFLADQNPILESISIFKIDNNEEINYIPEKNNLAQDGNRRQWITIAMAILLIKNLNIKAIAKKSLKNEDDDDIKLIIDGNIQQNKTDKSHKNWFWCGRVLNGQEKEFNQDLNLAKGLHYIELWADRMPEIKQIKIVLGKIETGNEGGKKFGKIALYKDIEEADFVNLRSEPEIKDNIITQIKTEETIEIIDDFIEGEYIQNKSNIWHKIRYQKSEGYMLSSYIEISGQTREQVIEKIKILAKLHGIDGNYAIALAGCESHYKPYAVSYSGALGIFQLIGIARDDLRKRFNFKISARESFEIEKNIEGGIIYLKHQTCCLIIIHPSILPLMDFGIIGC